MHRRAQWWLVITSPSGETKLPEHPSARRTLDRRTWSSQAWSGENPCVFWTRALGKVSKVHIPSSARTAGAERRTARRVSRRSLGIGEGRVPRWDRGDKSMEFGLSPRSGNTRDLGKNPGFTVLLPSVQRPARCLQGCCADMRFLLVAVLLVPAAVRAAPVLVPLSRGVELRTQSLADPASADLVVQSRILAARYGIRCVAGDAFGP